MANHHAWQPQEEGVKEICGLLLESKVPSGDQNRVWQQLQRCNRFPDFNNYLAFILCRAEGQSSEVRQAAGLMLKNNLKSSYQAMPLGYQQYIKAELRPRLGAADKQVRATVAIVISAVVQQGNGQDWPEIFQAFVQCLDSNDYNHMEGALDTLSKICEDKPEALDQDVVGLSERPINVFIPRLLQFFASPHAVLRRMALSAVNQFVVLFPPALFVNMDTYVQGLFSLANDSAAEVRKLVCAGLVQLLEVQPSYLQPHMRNVIEYMLQANCDPDEDVSLESCEFWSTFCEAHLPQEMLREFLPHLISVLLNNMVYADDDEALLEAEDDEHAPDREQDIKPRFHQPRVHGADGAEEDEEDDDLRNSWNLRKCSAAGLDILSTVFGDEILPILMPLVQARLSATTYSAWKEREAAVLALGAVAEGCIFGLLPHLSQIVAFFVPLLEDKRPLVRSITCWTLSRYSKWIVQAIGQTTDGQVQFDTVLTGLLSRILDSNKRVQEAACSAFATLEDVTSFLFSFTNFPFCTFPNARCVVNCSGSTLYLVTEILQVTGLVMRQQKNWHHVWSSFCSISCMLLESISDRICESCMMQSAHWQMLLAMS